MPDRDRDLQPENADTAPRFPAEPSRAPRERMTEDPLDTPYMTSFLPDAQQRIAERRAQNEADAASPPLRGQTWVRHHAPVSILPGS
jgi:hypothetical protein